MKRMTILKGAITALLITLMAVGMTACKSSSKYEAVLFNLKAVLQVNDAEGKPQAFIPQVYFILGGSVLKSANVTLDGVPVSGRIIEMEDGVRVYETSLNNNVETLQQIAGTYEVVATNTNGKEFNKQIILKVEKDGEIGAINILKFEMVDGKVIVEMEKLGEGEHYGFYVKPIGGVLGSWINEYNEIMNSPEYVVGENGKMIAKYSANAKYLLNKTMVEYEKVYIYPAIYKVSGNVLLYLLGEGRLLKKDATELLPM